MKKPTLFVTSLSILFANLITTPNAETKDALDIMEYQNIISTLDKEQPAIDLNNYKNSVHLDEDGNLVNVSQNDTYMYLELHNQDDFYYRTKVTNQLNDLAEHNELKYVVLNVDNFNKDNLVFLKYLYEYKQGFEIILEANLSDNKIAKYKISEDVDKNTKVFNVLSKINTSKSVNLNEILKYTDKVVIKNASKSTLSSTKLSEYIKFINKHIPYENILITLDSYTKLTNKEGDSYFILTDDYYELLDSKKIRNISSENIEETTKVQITNVLGINNQTVPIGLYDVQMESEEDLLLKARLLSYFNLDSIVKDNDSKTIQNLVQKYPTFFEKKDVYLDIINNEASEEILKSFQNNWFKDGKNLNFSPNKYITREEAAYVINKVLKMDNYERKESKNYLEDTDAKYIYNLIENNYMTLSNNKRFEGSELYLKSDLLKMLNNKFNINATSLDARISTNVGVTKSEMAILISQLDKQLNEMVVVENVIEKSSKK